MKLIAVHTIHGRKVVRAAETRKDRARAIDVIAKPGMEFDTVEFGIADDEAQTLIVAGAARRRMREVADTDAADDAGEGGSGAAQT